MLHFISTVLLHVTIYIFYIYILFPLYCCILRCIYFTYIFYFQSVAAYYDIFYIYIFYFHSTVAYYDIYFIYILFPLYCCILRYIISDHIYRAKFTHCTNEGQSCEKNLSRYIYDNITDKTYTTAIHNSIIKISNIFPFFKHHPQGQYINKICIKYVNIFSVRIILEESNRVGVLKF